MAPLSGGRSLDLLKTKEGAHLQSFTEMLNVKLLMRSSGFVQGHVLFSKTYKKVNKLKVKTSCNLYLACAVWDFYEHIETKNNRPTNNTPKRLIKNKLD